MTPYVQKWTRRASTSALFVALTAVMTWPQLPSIATHAANHHDVLFNLWRLRWIAHALSTSPQRLFDGNLFHPERLVLTFSDAMLVEGLLAAPLLWIGLPPLLVHNLVLLGAIAASGIGMFVLAKHLSGSTAGAVAAGIIYSFAPYRFDHYMHMELQWAVWVPWVFWALQRTIETGAAKYGALTGVFAALQLMSSLYYAVFLALLLPAVAVLQLLGRTRGEARTIFRALAAGALIAAAVSAVYAAPYLRGATRVLERDETEVTRYSAKPQDYLTATSTNAIYGERRRARPERRLFPGVVAPLLALVGLLMRTPRPVAVVYLVGGVLAFELSLGMYGLLFPFLYDHIGVFQSLRAPARASIFCLFFLGVLAAQGCAAILSSLKPRAAQAFGIAVAASMLAEYWVAPLPLIAYPNEPPPLYSWLSEQPDGVVAEFPMGDRDPTYGYMSTFHWKPLLNGYSGFVPRSYLDRLDRLERFPEPHTIARLRTAGVTYVIVHADGYSRDELQRIDDALAASDLQPLGEFADGWTLASVFRIR